MLSWVDVPRPKLLAGRLLAGVALAVIYVIAGRLGLLLAVPPGYATAIFPPAGIAVAAMFIGGSTTLPWVFLGSFLLNIWIGCGLHHGPSAAAIAVATVIAAASTLQAAVGGWALRRLIGYPTALDTGRDIARFFLSAPAVCLTSATVSLAGMTMLHAINVADLGTSWFTWWMGDTLGVLLFLPLVMLLAGEPRTVWAARARPVGLPMILFFALFVAIFTKVSAWENQQSLLEFRLWSQQVIDNLQAQLGAQEALLEQLGTSFDGPSPLSRGDFGVRTREQLARFPTIQAIEWAPRVLAANRAAFEAVQQHEQPAFAIREQDAAGGLRRAADRAEYYPVTYLEPLGDNRAAVGFDLLSNAARSDAILRTTVTGSVSASAPIRLVQAPDDQTGFLLALAVPRGPNGPGIVLTVMRMATLMDALLGVAHDQLGIQLLDLKAGVPLFDSFSPGGSPVRTQNISFGGRTYRIQIAPTRLYFAQRRGWQSLALLMIGVLSTSLLGALLMLSTGERQRFARLLSERTRERDRIWQVSEDLLGVSNFEGYFISVNPAWTRTLGWSEAEIKTIHVNELRHPDDFAIGTEGRRRLAEGVGTVRMENRFRHKDGSYRWIYWTMTAEQGLIYVIGRNVTADREAAQARRQIEEQLRQSQKMESVGQLTGGIAHDFNNLLTIIIGNLQLLERALGSSANDRVRRAVTAAISGATRAATLTHRLLAYAQKQPLRPREVYLNELVTDMADLIRRTHGETIHYDFALGEDVPSCFCDSNQLETALLNLVINARDAMPEGGRLKIETGQAVLDHAGAGMRDLPAGTYAVLTVSDTGIGMSADTVARAFEPFFTTKPVGKGTGLGLSMVYGFVKQSKGHIEVDSALGRGTTVRIYLPSLAAIDAQAPPSSEDSSPDSAESGNNETILVVEDDAEVRLFVADTLRDLDYRVIEAADASAAMEVLAQIDLTIDLLLTDVVMPGIDGRELAIRAAAIRPHMKRLFMTGYSQTGILRPGYLDPDVELLEKPFRGQSLATRVRRILDSNIEIVGSAAAPANLFRSVEEVRSRSEPGEGPVKVAPTTLRAATSPAERERWRGGH